MNLSALAWYWQLLIFIGAALLAGSLWGLLNMAFGRSRSNYREERDPARGLRKPP